MEPQPKRVSIVVPMYNEADNVLLFHAALSDVLRALPYVFEIIVVDDGSTDATSERIATLMQQDERVRLLSFSRNFGKENAVTAGIHHATGAAAVILDGDLQHPPALIPSFIRAWENGADMVIGMRERNANEGFIKRLGSDLFYRLVSVMADTDIRPRSTDFRLVDRTVIDVFNQMRERNRMTRSLFDWLGFKKEYIPFSSPPRVAGKSGYGYRKLFTLAMATFVAHSLLPLKVAGYIGIVITAVTVPLGAFMYVTRFLLDNPFSFSGPAILAVINLFLTGITLSCLGLIALYIANIHDQVVGRPLYVLRKERGKKVESNQVIKESGNQGRGNRG